MAATYGSQETRAWMRLADAEGIELPEEIVAARANVDELDARRKGLGAPIAVPSPQVLMATGTDQDKAIAQAKKIKAKAKEREELREVLGGARWQANAHLERLVQRSREALVKSIRANVTALIEEARGPVKVLAPFHPAYEAKDVAFRGGPEELEAFQTVAALERRYGLYASAWRASMYEPLKELGRVLDHRFYSEADLYFSNPERLANVDLTGRLYEAGRRARVNPTVFTIAAEDPAVGFRFAVPEEVEDVHDLRKKVASGDNPEPAPRLAWYEPVLDMRPRSGD